MQQSKPGTKNSAVAARWWKKTKAQRLCKKF